VFRPYYFPEAMPSSTKSVTDVEAAMPDGQPSISDAAVAMDRGALVSLTQRGAFWKPCPGTTAGYYCCGYQILTPLTGCGMYCAYCVLQVYHDHQCQVVFDNFDDLEREVRTKMADWHGVVRFGTGEFGDSLYLEDRLGLSRKIAALLEPYPNAVVEFKTKSANVSDLGEIRTPGKVVVGFSMNTPAMVAELERDTASLSDRLNAAAACERMGFWLAFHFDPMVWSPAWEDEYRDVVRMIFGAVRDPSRIAWWSLGGLRCVPALKKHLRGQRGYSTLFSGELLLGEDRKYRYFRPIRTAFYRAMQDEIMKHHAPTPVYLCMESPEVWEESGMAGRIPRGLVSYLDERGEEMLGLRA
jgi:spore photoproduct lyase